MITHELSLATEPFEAISNGTKVIESRLFDEKRQKIQLGDHILFKNRDRPDVTLQVKVIGLLRYSSFELLFKDSPPEKFGGTSVNELLIQINQFYVPEEQERYGILGIRIQKI
jgi:ASC-1-like (ASCH) protein